MLLALKTITDYVTYYLSCQPHITRYYHYASCSLFATSLSSVLTLANTTHLH